VGLLAALLLYASPGLARQQEKDEYLQRDTRGFTVQMRADALKSPLLKPACDLLEQKLAELETVLPAEALARLRAIPFWMHAARDNGAMIYHPSRKWLEEHALNPDMARGVEISNMDHFIKWCSHEQPMMVLHELSHAYHDTVLGQNWAPLQTAFENAQKTGLYESVPYILSKEKKRAYALTDRSEYFAELSEAYFGKNDFFPYTRADLETYDPVGFAMVERAWLAGGR
jgi:hypothetical protein